MGRALTVIAKREYLRHSSLIMREPCGFTGNESEFGRSVAEFYSKHGYISAKQYKWWTMPCTRGRPRICKYWQQLQIEASEKIAREAHRRRKYLPDQIDLFDSDEVVMDRAEAEERKRNERDLKSELWRYNNLGHRGI